MELYARARRGCSDLLTAFELIMRDGIEVTLRARPDFPDPLAQVYPAYVLIEAAAGGTVDLRGLMESFLGGADDIIRDGVIASSRAQGERLWLYRETMVESQGRGGRYLRTDVSVPISRIADFITAALQAVRGRHPEAMALAYGHVGDGNVHFNVIPPQGQDPVAMDALFHSAEALIFDVVDQMGGSISAEHGIGRVKQHAFLERIDAVSLDLATRLKLALDPTRILSNGRILPEDSGVQDG
jgi:FAD/FMN-containing dehydrogenase